MRMSGHVDQPCVFCTLQRKQCLQQRGQAGGFCTLFGTDSSAAGAAGQQLDCACSARPSRLLGAETHVHQRVRSQTHPCSVCAHDRKGQDHLIPGFSLCGGLATFTRSQMQTEREDALCPLLSPQCQPKLHLTFTKDLHNPVPLQKWSWVSGQAQQPQDLQPCSTALP